MDIGSLSIVGKTRKQNQDSILLKYYSYASSEYSNDWLLCAIADGMGGLMNGEMASRIAIETIDHEFQNMEGTADKFQRKLEFAFKEANSRVWKRGTELKGVMGTTLSVVLLSKEVLIQGSVGDSRIYHIMDNQSLNHTNDDSEAFDAIKKGLISESDLRNSPQRNYLTKAIGISQTLEVQTQRLVLSGERKILLASDGLWGAIEESEILRITSQNLSADQIVKNLVSEANEKDGSDNISAILVIY